MRNIKPYETEKQSRRIDEKQAEKNELDHLTGVLKKDAAEVRITSMMNRNRSGALLLCDVDGLKWINDQHGHVAGDECLKEVAQILAFMIRQDDVLGRCGGDEFFIFMPKCQEIQQTQEICKRIEKRFHMTGPKGKNKITLSVTAVSALWRSGDTCRSLFERADEELRKRKASLYMTGKQRNRGKDHYIKDVRMVRKELIEQIKKPGAYCQDYETFKGIYRFLERGIIRSGQKACVILITVVDEQGESLLPDEKDNQMERLGEDIHSMLRIGDVYTRYSSSQYLVLVIDTTEGQGDMIGDRIKERFLADSQGNNILIHHCYELQPARIVEIMELDELFADSERVKRRGRV